MTLADNSSNKQSRLARANLAHGPSYGNRWYTIGTYPETTAADARDAAEIALARVRLGESPGGERITKRAEMTLAQAIDFYEHVDCFVQRGIRQVEDVVIPGRDTPQGSVKNPGR